MSIIFSINASFVYDGIILGMTIYWLIIYMRLLYYVSNSIYSLYILSYP